MENNNHVAEILNDLIRINNDRISGYEKALSELDPADSDLNALYQQYAAQSRSFAQQLAMEVRQLGKQPSSSSSVAGKLYRTWMDIKASFSSDERKSTLEACEFGEDAAQQAYREAMSTSNRLPIALVNILSRQQAELRSAHDNIKRQRDMQPRH